MSDPEQWVRARHACSPFEVFVQLRNGAATDVEVRNELKPADQRVGFSLMGGEETFSVLRQGPRISASIEFRLTKSGITVRNGAGETILEGSLALTDDAECRLKLAREGSLLTLPQFRKRALEDLFFGFE